MLKLANIQVLRAIAAFAVVFYHTGLESSTVCAETGRVCAFGFWGGGFGVALFFMISGFIMVTISWNSFGQDGASIGFLKRRITRIVPLYWLVTTAAVIGALLLPNLLKVPVTELSYVVSSYLFWAAARVNGLVRPVANLGWTLNLEMMFGVWTGALLRSRTPADACVPPRAAARANRRGESSPVAASHQSCRRAGRPRPSLR